MKYAISEALEAKDIRRLQKRLSMTQKELAEWIGVSAKTIERWESGTAEIRGPVVLLARILMEQPELVETFSIPEKKYPLRLWYMHGRDVCTLIDVDERERKVWIRNYTDRIQYRAFGVLEKPDFEAYEEFLESRCFPRTRDRMKLQLREYGLPYYDPLLIVEKTQGRTEEDEFWVRIER